MTDKSKDNTFTIIYAVDAGTSMITALKNKNGQKFEIHSSKHEIAVIELDETGDNTKQILTGSDALDFTSKINNNNTTIAWAVPDHQKAQRILDATIANTALELARQKHNKTKYPSGKDSDTYQNNIAEIRKHKSTLMDKTEWWRQKSNTK